MTPTPSPSSPLDSNPEVEARMLVAQAWCTKANAHKVMDPELANAVAEIFAPYIKKLRAQGADPGQPAAGLDLDDPNGVMAALNAAIADGKHTEGCKFETTCTCWKAKCRDARTKLRAALSALSQGPADPDHAIGDEEESADLHMQWASDGDDLEASFNKLHAYAIRLEERLAAHPVPAAPAAPVDVIAMEAALIPIFKQCLRDSGEGDDEQHAREYTVDAIKALRGLATHPGSASTGEASHG